MPRHPIFFIATVVAVVLMGLLAIPRQTVGQPVPSPDGKTATVMFALSFCIPGEDFEKVKATLVNGDYREYVRLMQDPDVMCWDVDLTPGQAPTPVILMRKVGEVCVKRTGTMADIGVFMDVKRAELMSWVGTGQPCPRDVEATSDVEEGD